MSILTSLTRTWLTRSTQPFLFRQEADERLPYADCTGLGLYVHIPFCEKICDFCPYCKEIYVKEKCDRYLDALLEEIRLVGRQNGGRKRVTSLYFGGGTPSLAADRISEIIETLGKYFEITEGIGLELHPNHVTVGMLRKLRAAGVTKISIGIQSFQEKFQDMLGRRAVDAAEMAAALAEVPFETVSMDLIFALPGQTLADLQADIEIAFSHGANHIAIYPFIDFSFTASKVAAMGKREKRALLDGITEYCAEKGYYRDSIWTFAKEKSAHYSSMTRDNFLGFGCSATTLLSDQFKVNTFSTEEYGRRLREGRLPTALTLRFSLRQRMLYYLFWTAYSTRVDAADFGAFFGVPLGKQYGFELWLAKCLGFVTEQDGVYTMTKKGAFYYHYYEGFYTLAYIDKMWHILRKEAFPQELRL